ncbi:MAG: hypothetical protein R6U27_11065 [Desulfobacterales bacterium]
MKSEAEIREEIKRIENYAKKWPCSQVVVRESELMIDMLKWVLEEDSSVNP